MTDYSKTTDFAAKDSLPTGNAGKIVKGTEIDDEFVAIQTAIATKADTSSIDYKNRIVSYHHVQKATDSTSTSTTAFDLGMTVTMSPASATNKLLIFATTRVENRGTGDDAGSEFYIYVDGTETIGATQAFFASNGSVQNAGIEGTVTLIHSYTPGSTAEVEIALYGNAIFGGTTHTFYADSSSLTVMEIEP